MLLFEPSSWNLPDNLCLALGPPSTTGCFAETAFPSKPECYESIVNQAVQRWPRERTALLRLQLAWFSWEVVSCSSIAPALQCLLGAPPGFALPLPLFQWHFLALCHQTGPLPVSLLQQTLCSKRPPHKQSCAGSGRLFGKPGMSGAESLLSRDSASSDPALSLPYRQEWSNCQPCPFQQEWVKRDLSGGKRLEEEMW